MESIAEREIAKDPIAFIREESMLKPSGRDNQDDELGLSMDFGGENYEEIKIENCEAIDTSSKP